MAKETVVSNEMTVGGTTYEILSFLKEGEKSVKGDVMVSRTEEMGANLGESDLERIFEYQDDIQVELHGEVIFVFTDCRHRVSSESVACANWDGDSLQREWRGLSLDWSRIYRVLRRKPGQNL